MAVYFEACKGSPFKNNKIKILEQGLIGNTPPETYKMLLGILASLSLSSLATSRFKKQESCFC